MKFEVSRRARRQIERIQAWWTAHRPDARALFVDELALVETQLRTSPELGSVYAEGSRGPIRRVVLPRTAHHLYYRYEAARSHLIVLAVWGGPRGRGPRL